MTEAPTPKQMAKDVAREIERRRLRRKLFILAAIVTLLVLAFLYLRCGRGWGTGGKGEDAKGTGSGTATVTADAGPRRCDLRVESTGILLDGKPATQDAAVEACKAAGGAEVVVPGDTAQGVWAALEAALDAADVPTHVLKK